jgi:teichuronic acid exporter
LSLKQKTISGLFWSFSDNMVSYILNFIIGIILARILVPSEFGIIGMITVFIAVSQSLIDSGFGQALIRKKDASDTDYSTVFYFNLVVGVCLYLILFLSAGPISRFYSEPILIPIIKVFGINIIINSFSVIQRTILIKKVNFKLQTKITFLSSLISGSIGIAMAYKGFGVWSLVWRNIINNSLQSLFLWIFNRWFPSRVFSINSFREMFAFGSKVLVTGLIDTLYKNIYLVVIGKFFTSGDLGYYTRADQFSKLPSQNITHSVQKVSYPVLATLQDDKEKLKAGYKKLITNTMYITFILMLGMAAVAKPMILTLVGEKWLPSVIYLQLLCFSGMLYPLQSLNLNMLNVQGRSDLFLNLEIVKKLLSVPVIVIGIFAGLKVMIIGMVMFSFIAYYINSYYSGKLINYSVKEQFMDILPSFITALLVAVIIYIPSVIFTIKPLLLFTGQLISGLILFILFSWLFKLESYFEIKSILIEKGNQVFSRRRI